MTTYITDRKGNKLQLTGDLLTGETYAIKDYIKKYMDGKWVKEQKAWRVNVAKVEKLLATVGAAIRIDDEPVDQPAPFMTYEHFLHSADDPNSDY